jgi:hypothetical protein
LKTTLTTGEKVVSKVVCVVSNLNHRHKKEMEA